MSMEIEEGHRTASTLAKLELVKEIRSKMDHMNKLKENLLQEIEASRREDRNLIDYRSEMEMLMQEKLAHVEELRKIHADINSMELVIKQAEQSKVRSVENAKRLHAEFLPVKVEVDRLRQSCLGLERLPELCEEEPSMVTFELFEPQMQPMDGPPPPSGQNWPPPPHQANNCHNMQQQQREEILLNYQKQQQQNSVAQAAVAAYMMSHQNGPNILTRSPPNSGANNKDRQNLPPTGPPFRTPQLAPMKKCQTCSNDIHRNAPICPVCKAKSRSRNPKKAKKKN